MADGSSAAAAGAHAHLSLQLTSILSQLASNPQQQAAQQAHGHAQGQQLYLHQQLAQQLAQQQSQQQQLLQQHQQLHHHQAMSLDVSPAAQQGSSLAAPDARQPWRWQQGTRPRVPLSHPPQQEEHARAGVPNPLPMAQQPTGAFKHGQEQELQPLAEWLAAGAQHAAHAQTQAQAPPVKQEQQQERQAEAGSAHVAAADAAPQQPRPGTLPGKSLASSGAPSSLVLPAAAAVAGAGRSDMAAQHPECQPPIAAAQPSTQQVELRAAAAHGSQLVTSPAPASAAPACVSPLPALAEQGLRALSSASEAQLLESVIKQLHQLTGARLGTQQAQQAQQAQQSPGLLTANPSTEALLAALATVQSRASLSRAGSGN